MLICTTCEQVPHKLSGLITQVGYLRRARSLFFLFTLLIKKKRKKRQLFTLSCPLLVKFDFYSCTCREICGRLRLGPAGGDMATKTSTVLFLMQKHRK